MRWPKGPPHLALNPPYFFFCFCFLFFVLFLFFFGGFKGQVRWPKGPPHLALNPPFLFCCFCCFVFFGGFFGCLIQKKTLFFPPEKGIFCLFSVFLFLSPLALLGLPLFLFLFLCLSFFFFSFFLPSCLCFCFLLVPCFSLFLSFFLFFFALLSRKEQHQNIKLQAFPSSIFYLFWVSCLFSFKFLFLIFALS